MINQISASIKKLLIYLFIIYSALYFIFSFVTLKIFIQNKITVANVLSESVEKNLIIRDIREVTLVLDKTIPKHFLSATFVKLDNSIVFSLPIKYDNNFLNHPPFFSYKIQIPIYSGDSAHIGSLIFFFSTTWLFISLVLIWVTGLILLVPVFLYLKKQILQKHLEDLQQSRVSTIIEVAKQVSHDIRSPLSALNMILGSLNQIPEEKRLIIRSAVNRINDIANTLLTQAKNMKAETKNSEISEKSESNINANSNIELFEAELIPSLVEMLVSEKRVQFRNHVSIEIETDLRDSYGAFAKVNPTELKRVLSNLINNAVEAFESQHGKIIVAVRGYHKNIQIIVQDNGKGIPKDILENLGKEGVSHGKEGTSSGSGLGVFHAKKTIESFEGIFKVNSHEGSGTIISITLPRAITPNWFVSELLVNENQTVVVVDDDSSIHQIWHDRFNSLKTNIPIISFTAADEFKKWINTQPKTKIESEYLFLMDFELLGQKQTGLDLIEELKIHRQSILVTSRYEENHIRTRTKKLNLKLIPKGMTGFIPIKYKNPISPDHT